jgi:DNA (cytosine-5)-methyltransferase 1
MNTQLTAVDLFSGCGGLTVGLRQAGFSVTGAVELDKTAHATYVANHGAIAGKPRDIRRVKGSCFVGAGRTIDLVAGCPPCQGFSSLTSKKGKKDPRNRLVAEFARIVREVRPRAVMMENVPGLADRGGPLFFDLLEDLKGLGYVVGWRVLQVADYGVPQRRRRLVLLAGLGFSIPFPSPTHSRDGSQGLPRWKTLRETIKGVARPVTLSYAKARGGPAAFGWNVVRDMSEENKKRIRHARAGRSWKSIPKRLRPDCHKDIPLGFRNAYGRMRWNEPAVTITSGCTTLSKGRFGHPKAHRTISVHEAALLQTFPADYQFATAHIDKVCAMIGNALPCKFAEILAVECAKAICADVAKGTAGGARRSSKREGSQREHPPARS